MYAMATVDRPELDAIDRKIVGSLVRNGRLSVRRLAEVVSLSTSATSERLRRLEQSRVITGYTAQVAPEVVDRPVDAVVGVRARPGVDRRSLEAWIAGQEAIAEAVHLTGPHDYLLRLRCRTTAELDGILMAMKSDAGVDDTETRIVLRSLAVGPVPL
jgi:Lrp/AsnC family transcriptional regulator, leucine-responsive regulatory protein